MTEIVTESSEQLGQLLIAQKWLSADGLKEALQKQTQRGGRLGEVLLGDGVINEQQLGQCLAAQSGMSFMTGIDMDDVDRSLASILPISYLKQARALPLERSQERVRIAISDPSTMHKATMVARQIGGVPEWVLVPPESLLNAINSVFEEGTTEDAEDLVGEFDDVLNAFEDSGEPVDLLDATDEAPIIRLINTMLFRALRERASDIHFEPFENEMVIRFRVDGVLYEILKPPKRMQANLVSRIKIMAGLNIAEKRLPQDGRIRIKVAGRDVDIRVSSLPTQYGERVVLRLLERSNVQFDLPSVGFDESILKYWESIIEKKHGIVLVTGPTGSGKTTSLYASLAQINSVDKNIITIEDPVEYQLAGVGQIQVNSKIDLTFAAGLRSILRQDPDVILVGEIRDLETAEIAIQASLTGHLVFSTLHTNDAPSAVTRLVDMGIEPFLVSSSVLAILAQRLVRTLCNECKEPVSPSADELSTIGLKKADAKGMQIYQEVGCAACMGTGYRGRTAIHELLVIDENVREMILNAADALSIRRAASTKGMRSLRDAGASRVLTGLTSVAEVLRVTQDDHG